MTDDLLKNIIFKGRSLHTTLKTGKQIELDFFAHWAILVYLSNIVATRSAGARRASYRNLARTVLDRHIYLEINYDFR